MPPVIEIDYLGQIEGDSDRGFEVPLRVAEKIFMIPVDGSLPIADGDPVHLTPYGLPGAIWSYKARAYRVLIRASISNEEIAVRIKHYAIRQELRLRRIRRDIEAFERFESAIGARRERIAESVRMFVWRRDEGRCVTCGGQERLEFDHIIPVSEGGSSTERNIQLLCEKCNRAKGCTV